MNMLQSKMDGAEQESKTAKSDGGGKTTICCHCSELGHKKPQCLQLMNGNGGNTDRNNNNNNGIERSANMAEVPFTDLKGLFPQPVDQEPISFDQWTAE